MIGGTFSFYSKKELYSWIIILSLFICILPIPAILFASLDTSIYRKTFIVGVLLVLFLLDRKPEYSIGILEGSLLVLIFYQFLSTLWAFNMIAIWTSVFDHILLFVLLLSLKRFGTISRFKFTSIILIFNLLLILPILFFWVRTLIMTGNISQADYSEFSRFFGYNTNYMATLLAMSFPFYWFISKQSKPYKVCTYLLLPIHGLCLISLNSRASLIAVIAITVLLYLRKSEDLKKNLLRVLKLISIAGAAIILISFLFSDPKLFLNSMNPLRFNGIRMNLWINSMEILFSTNPLLGIGSNNWHLLFPTTDISKFSIIQFSPESYNRAHSLFVERLTELGIVGYIPFLIFTFFPIYQFLHSKPNFKILIFFSVYLTYIFLAALYAPIYSPSITSSGPAMLWIFAILIINNELPVDNVKSLVLKRKWIIAFMCLVCLSFFSYKIHQQTRFLIFKMAEKNNNLRLAEQNVTKIYHKHLAPNYQGFQNAAFIISQFYINQNEIENSLYWLNIAVKDQPHNIIYKLRLANILFRKKEYEAAIQQCEEVIGLNRTTLQAYLIISKVAIKTQNSDLYFSNAETLNFLFDEFDTIYRSKSKIELSAREKAKLRNVNQLRAQWDKLESKAGAIF